MKKIGKTWALWEIIFICVSIIAVTICFFISAEKQVLSYICSMLGVVSVFMIAKGLFFAPVLDIVYNVLYIIISVITCYYGEAIIYVVIMMPLSISSLISWFKNKKEDNIVKTNQIKVKEWLILILVCVIFTIAFYFLLKVLNTSQLIVSTISIITSVFGAYLLLRRSSYFSLFFILNDIILIVLWTLTTFDFGLMYLPTVLSFVVFLVNDTYAFVRWKKQEKVEERQLQEVK